MSTPVLIYGGTFDPVHAGHVAVAQAAADALGTAEIRVLPCGDPPHRNRPVACGPDRAQMLRLAFAAEPRASVDERELRRRGRSYTVDTLAELRAELGADLPLVLLLGADAAAGLRSWYRPEELPRLGHLLVFARPGTPLPDAAAAVGFRPAANLQALRNQPFGWACELDVPVSDASSTAIRNALAAGEPAPQDLPENVARWLHAHAIYRAAAP